MLYYTSYVTKHVPEVCNRPHMSDPTAFGLYSQPFAMSRRTVYMLSEELAKAGLACLASNCPNLIPKVAALLPSNRSRSPIVHLLAKHLFFVSPSTSSSLRVINPTPASTEDLTAFHDPGIH